MYMCMYIYIYMYICIYVYMYICIYEMSAFRLRCLFDCLFPSAGEEYCMQSGACKCELARY